ncbi:hypothetical protein H1C71_004541 [Ictidomys tridecemlineatus]|nr:hypothetical protein H1C71_004541 [Ictidomys tridecemlineatus]
MEGAVHHACSLAQGARGKDRECTAAREGPTGTDLDWEGLSQPVGHQGLGEGGRRWQRMGEGKSRNKGKQRGKKGSLSRCLMFPSLTNSRRQQQHLGNASALPGDQELGSDPGWPVLMEWPCIRPSLGLSFCICKTREMCWTPSSPYVLSATTSPSTPPPTPNRQVRTGAPATVLEGRSHRGHGEAWHLGEAG